MRASRTMRVVGAIGLMVFGALAVGATVASAGEEEIRVPQGAFLLPDRYIVVLEDAAFGAGPISRSAVSQLADEMARRHRGRVTHVYEHALRGFATVMSEAQAQALARDPLVKYVEQDSVVWALDTQVSPIPWGLDRIDQRELPTDGRYTYARTGAGVNVYIIDTGIRTTHVEFEGRAFEGFTVFNDGLGSDDCNGHGTHVAGTVGGATWGVAKKATLVAVRVLDCDGFGWTSSAIAGVNWITGNFVAPAVANMSLGGRVSSALDDAVRNSIAAGVTYVVAAGNDGDNACDYSPARVPEALTVGASASPDAIPSFSAQGPCLDLFAPGVHITSAWHTSDTATEIASGTSMASPHVAGVAALYLEHNPGALPSDVEGTIVGGILDEPPFVPGQKQPRQGATAGRLTGVSADTPNLLLYSRIVTGLVPPSLRAEDLRLAQAQGVPQGGPIPPIVMPPRLQSVTLNPNNVTGGAPSTGTVTITGTPPLTGMTVSLSMAPLLAPARVPATVTLFPNSGGTAEFAVKTRPVTTLTTVTILASYGGVTRSATLTIHPPVLRHITCNPDTVVGGSPVTCTVFLNGPAPSGGLGPVPAPSGGLVIDLYDYAMVAAPDSVIVPAGQHMANFPVTTEPVGASRRAVIGASYGGVTKEARVTITPPPVTPPPAAALASLTCNPANVVGGSPSTCRTNLTAPAPPGGLVIALSSNSPLAAVPTNLTVPAGQHMATFQVATKPVTNQTAITISASHGGLTKTATVTVRPPALSQLLLGGLPFYSLPTRPPASGTTITGFVALDGPAPPGGADIVFLFTGPHTQGANTSPVVMYPQSLRIQEGMTNATFQFTIYQCPSYTTSTYCDGKLSATYKGATLSVQVTVPR